MQPVFDAEFDRKQLSQTRKRFQALARARLERLRSIARDRERDLVDVLPLLFHVNHPLLPGWVNAEVPASLSDYTPTQTALAAAHKLARSFNHEKRAALRRDILALFLMGSAGTLGQSADSDLDVWVVVRPDLSDTARDLLRQKCARIEQHARDQGCRLNAYLMTEDSFRQNNLGDLSDEHSGSTQRWLLLDEFYRTSIWLAGRTPLWWLVPPDQEAQYEALTDRLLTQRFVRSSDYLDFGAVPAIPPNEFFSAAVWQLYKAIDAPHKSVLKLLLMEAYVQASPPLPPLSALFKQAVTAGQADLDALDPYGLMVATVEHYLQGRGEPARLQLLRRCLYLKADEKLSLGGHSWQRERLRSLSESWGWGPAQWRELDSHRRWPYEKVAAERKALVNELSASYRALSSYARVHSDLAKVNQQELTVLGRKLYAALERRPGKVELLQYRLDADLAEPQLVFGGPDAQGIWSLARADGAEPLRRGQDAVALLVWALANGLLTRQTRLKVSGTELQLADIQSLQRVVAEWLPLPLPQADDADLRTPVQLTRALVLVNVGVDADAERAQKVLHQKGLQVVSSRTDAFCYGAARENLIQRLHLVWLNSWGELCVQRFDRNSSGADLLQVLHGLLGEARLVPPVQVHCQTGVRASSLARRVTELLDHFLATVRPQARQTPCRYVLRTGEGWQVFLIDGARIDRIDCQRVDELLDVLAQPLPGATELLFDAHALDDLPFDLIYSQRRNGQLQLFFKVETDRVDLYLLDEADALCVAQQPFHDLDSLLRPWCLFLSNVGGRLQALRGVGAPSEPELYEIVRPRAGEPAHLRRLELPERWLPARYYAINARARLVQGQLQDRVLSGPDEEFAEWEWGEGLFQRAAEALLRQRARRERYPCYLTDLVLDEPGVELGCAHFVRFKLALEASLNQALNQLQDPHA